MLYDVEKPSLELLNSLPFSFLSVNERKAAKINS